VILLLYSDCTNYVDPHPIITIVLMFWLHLMFFLTDGFVLSMFDSCGSHFDYFICFIWWITKGICYVLHRANILRMLLIMLLSHVEIHICYR
jgi:hypothetical protein